MGIFETEIIFLIIAIGLYLFVNIAWSERKGSFALKTFFLGGAKIGPELTEHNTIGMTFAWSGGIWFFATLALNYGPWVILMQLPWCLSIIGLSYLFTRIHKVTQNKTIHGFLSDIYGTKTRYVSAIATTFGYIFNTGFELYWSSMMLSTILGNEKLTLPVAIMLSIVTAVYCSIGGYKANASTDKPQNILGVISLSALALFVSFKSQVLALEIASIIFCIGSLIYIILVMYFPKLFVSKKAKYVSYFAILLTFITILIGVILSNIGSDELSLKAFANSPFPWHLFVGIIFFQLLFNVVDMANWQGIAANGDLTNEQHKNLRWALIRSALFLNWFPALGGALIGLGLRYGISGINDNNIFEHAFHTVNIGQGSLMQGITIGLILLGLISTTLSTADSYLMSAVQTLNYDIFYFNKVKKLVSNDNDEEQEKKFVINAKKFLLPTSIFMVIFFWLAYSNYQKIGNVLDFQMIMYSFAISLFPSVIYGLFSKNIQKYDLKLTSFVSILTGIIASVTPYLYVVLYNSESELRSVFVNLTPVFSILVSSLIFYIGYLSQKIKKENV